MLPLDLDGVVDLEGYIPDLRNWFRSEWKGLMGTPPGRGRGLLMGAPIWGQEFIDRFFFFSLPSILSAKNLAVLQEHGCRIVIFTEDQENRDYIERFWLMKKALAIRGIDVQIKELPAHIMRQVPDKPLNKYWLLGTVQNLMVQMAAHDGMAFHMLMPDHLYSDEYFPNLFRLAKDHEGIAQTSISADIHKCLPELEQWRQPDGSLAAPAVELGDLGWKHLHQQTRYNIMNDVDITSKLPNSHFQCWQGKDRLYLFCCHMNAVYLSANVCKQAPIRLHNALDTELPAFMPKEVLVPEVEDGMAFLELSDDTKTHGVDRVSFPEFAYQCWNTVHFREDWMAFYETPVTVPIRPQETYLEEDEIMRRQRSIVAALMAAKPGIQALVQKQREELKARKDAAQAQASATAAAIAECIEQVAAD